jgi:predicted secreted protein
MYNIYGADIELEASSPDGQWLNNIIQVALDLEDLCTQIYNGFDPDNAIGTVLDQRVAINGIQRQAGTYTVTDITIVTSQSVTLYGMNQTAQPVFTVSDNAGNQYQLQATQTPGSAGTYVYTFQAVNPGAVLTTPNTITTAVTIVLGVTSVNNPTAAISTGLNEESDAALRVRRQQSVTIASQGFYQGLLSTLENIPGVTSAVVYENDTNSTDVNGVPGHTIWVIIAGSASQSAIANAIYTKRNAGCGMYGTINYNITQFDGTIFTVTWDVVVEETLYMQFNVTSINGSTVPNIAAIISYLVENLTPAVNTEVNINELATLAQDGDPNSLITSAGFSASPSGPFNNNILSPSAKNKQFQVQTPNIIVLPMITAPSANGQLTVSGANIISTATVVHGGNTLVFSTLGGYGVDHSAVAPHLSYAVTSGGGSIVSSTGVYTSGVAGTDVVTVTDANGNNCICTITVV